MRDPRTISLSPRWLVAPRIPAAALAQGTGAPTSFLPRDALRTGCRHSRSSIGRGRLRSSIAVHRGGRKVVAHSENGRRPVSKGASGEVARNVLPIPSRQHVGLTTYDAKDPDASYPPIETLRPPEGAPNVL